MFRRLSVALVVLASTLTAAHARAQSTPPACGVAAEHAALTLGCPPGMSIDAVPFASYGTPTGGCGALVQGSCHAAATATMVQRACVFRTRCTINADNAVFGDPCVGTLKRLAAQVTCRPFTRPSADAGAPPPDGGVATAGMKIGTNFWNLGWGIWDDVFKPDVDFASTTNPWQPAFLDEIKGYAALRFMDFGRINDSPEQRWSDRTAKSAARPAQERLAYEWMVDLCNRTHRDMWVNVPHQADADYAFQLATLIKGSLDPALKVYVEWSNETWNGIFAQTQYAFDRGNALALDPDPWTAAFKYHVYAAVRAFEQFDRVFGAGSPRLVKVVGGFIDNSWLAGVHVKALADARINPNGIKANAYAIAPYFGHAVDGKAGDAVTQLRAAVDDAVANVKAIHDVVVPAGLTLLAYEGGQHVLTNADVMSGQPAMYDLYNRLLDGVAPYLALFMHYVHSGSWASDGAWGSERFVGQPLDQCPKRRAILDWQAHHP